MLNLIEFCSSTAATSLITIFNQKIASCVNHNKQEQVFLFYAEPMRRLPEIWMV
jgi:hypothetical protein